MVLKSTQVADMRNRVEATSKKVSKAQNELVELCSQLHRVRTEVGDPLVGDFELLVNKISSHPKEYDRTVTAYKFESKEFKKAGLDFAEHLSKEIQKTVVESSASTGLGVAAGAATAFGAPTAAMAVATTFGTASTGAAISTLSGAALTKASLAWLGGGALAAGGGGMAAGNALLALAGPVGWTLAGLSVAAGLGYAAYKHNGIVEEATKMHRELLTMLSDVEVLTKQVSSLYGLTTQHTHGLRTMLTDFTSDAPKDYSDFSSRQKELLGAMHNNVLALGNLLNLKPGDAIDLTTPLQGQESANMGEGSTASSGGRQSSSGGTTQQQSGVGAAAAAVNYGVKFFIK